MPNLIDNIHEKLVDRITQIIDEHCAAGVSDGTEVACHCGAQGLSEDSRHVAEQIIDQLGLMPENIAEVKKRLRYVSASLDWELTKLEGAQC